MGSPSKAKKRAEPVFTELSADLLERIALLLPPRDRCEAVNRPRACGHSVLGSRPPPPLPLRCHHACALPSPRPVCPNSYKLNLVCRAWREGLVAARAVWECVAIDPRKKASTNRWVAGVQTAAHVFGLLLHAAGPSPAP